MLLNLSWLTEHASTPCKTMLSIGYILRWPAAQSRGSSQPPQAGRALGRGGCAGGGGHLKHPAAQVLHMIMGLEHMQSTNSFLQASMGAPSPGPSAFAPAAARPEPESHRQDRGQPDQAYRERRASHAAAGPSHSLPDSLGSSLARRAPAQPPPRPTERSRPPGLPLHHTTGGMHQPPAEPGTSHPGADLGRIPPAGEASPSRGQPQHRRSRSLGEGPDAAHLAARGPDARRMVTLASKRLQAALDTQAGHRRGSRESGGGSRDWDPEGAGSDSDATSFVTAGSHLEPEAGMATLPSYQALSGFGDPTGLDGSLQHSPLAAAQVGSARGCLALVAAGTGHMQAQVAVLCCRGAQAGWRAEAGRSSACAAVRCCAACRGPPTAAPITPTRPCAQSRCGRQQGTQRWTAAQTRWTPAQRPCRHGPTLAECMFSHSHLGGGCGMTFMRQTYTHCGTGRQAFQPASYAVDRSACLSRSLHMDTEIPSLKKRFCRCCSDTTKSTSLHLAANWSSGPVQIYSLCTTPGASPVCWIFLTSADVGQPYITNLTYGLPKHGQS